MTPDRELERLLATWFDDGPREASDRVVDTVAERIARQSQRPAWRLRWKEVNVTSRVRMVALLAALLAIVAIGFGIVGRQPNPTVLPTPTAQVSAEPSPTPAPAPTVSPIPSPTGPLAYRTVTFAVALSFVLDDGWSVAAESAGGIELHRADLEADVFDAATLRVEDPQPATPEPWPADWQAWLRSQPEFTVGTAEVISIGGQPATVVDVDVTVLSIDPRSILFYDNGRWGTNFSPERYRFLVVTAPSGSNVVVFLPSAPATFGADAAALDHLLGTLAFE